MFSGLTTVDFQRKLRKDDTGISIHATSISIESKPAESKKAKREEGENVCIYVIQLVFDRPAFVFGREHVSFTYFEFVSELL